MTDTHAYPDATTIGAVTGRRTVLTGSALVASAAALAACSSTDTAKATPAAGSPTTATAIGNVKPSSPAATESGLGNASDVKVGGGVIYPKEKIVVTQPSAGEYKAFSAICTHQGCVVGSVDQGQIICPCHGSAFSVKDGSVVQGPATTGLKEAKITVAGGKITQA